MLTLKYVGEKTGYEVSFQSVSPHVVQITGYFPVKQKGFSLYRDGVEEPLGDYTDYKTVYREVEQGAQFSDDGSTAPLPVVTFSAGYGGNVDGELTQTAERYEDLNIPGQIPEEGYKFTGWQPSIPAVGEISSNISFKAVFLHEKTLEEIKAEKIAEMELKKQEVMEAGINVTLADGSVEHFSLDDKETKLLMGLQVNVAAGEEKIPWHVSDETVHCKYYSNADMNSIITAAMACATHHETYIRDLKIYINSMENKETVEEATYGMVIPEEYRSEVLQDIYMIQQGE